MSGLFQYHWILSKVLGENIGCNDQNVGHVQKCDISYSMDLLYKFGAVTADYLAYKCNSSDVQKCHFLDNIVKTQW